MTPFDAFEARLEIAQASPAGDGSAIGRVDTVVGRATVVRTDGSQVSAEQGTPIFQGDTIKTALDGKLGIVFVDETRFSIGENGHMVIDSMIYDPGAQTGNSAFKVVEGVFSFISGQIAKTDADAMIIDTPVATIGIRGTHGAGKAAPQGTANTFTLMPEDATGAITGEITITTRTGVVTLNQPYQTTQVATPFLPPPTPLILPPSVIEKAFGTVVRTLPPSPAQPPGTTGQGTGQGGTAPQGPQGPGATARAEVVNRATERAFDQALAQGGSLEQAFAAATQVVVGAAVLGLQSPSAVAGATAPADFAQQLSAIVGNAVTNATQNPFGTGNINQGAVGGQGQGQGFDPFATFGPGVLNDPAALGKSISDAINNVFGGGFDPFGFGAAPPSAVRQAIEAAVVEKVTQQVIGHGTTAVFDETISSFTGNADNLTGTSLNTRFVMTQDAASGGFGGSDTINGGAGTDELALRNLHDFTLVYEATSSGGTATYKAGTDPVGTIAMTSIEQFYANDATEDVSGIGSVITLNSQGNAVRLAFDSGDAGKFGYILAGNASANTLSLANSTDLSGSVGSVSGSTVNSSSVFGGLIFGGAGDDTITGSAVGDVLFGGADNDTITPGGVNTGDSTDKDAVFGGAGNDTIIFSSSSNMGTSGAVQGGAGTGDKIQITETGTATYDFSQWGLSGLETLQVSGTTTVVAGNTFFEGLTGSGVTGSGTTTLHVSGTSLNLSSISLGSNVTSLSAASGSVNGGLTIQDSNSDTIGRTLTGGSGSDTLTGNGGADTFVGKGGNDTFNLGSSDGASDTVTFAAPGAANGFDTINNFTAGTSGDLLNFSAVSLFNPLLLSGTSAVSTQVLTGVGALSSSATVAIIDDAWYSGTTSTNSASAQASELAGFLSGQTTFANSILGALSSTNAKLAFIADTDANKPAVWYWNDGDGDKTIEASEFERVASLDCDISNLTSANVTG